ncbi:SDR family NAD(P)-dependent oxidoreductase [Pendulispora brunnea]|uniref:SDR family NAD(P)-dependent oxidoreductase n=1 Tax=Pendulispora brunnea TaxID=2905690 RepID=A0ABZ2KIJ4_9BACT
MIDHWLVDIENPMVRGHRVLGQQLLPGLAYIDLFFQVFRDRHEDPRHLELRNLSIYQPLVVTEAAPVSLAIDCTETQPGRWRVLASGNGQRYATAEMHRASPFVSDETLDMALVARSADRIVSLDEVYAGCRRMDLVHDAFMRAQGKLYISDSEIYVECELGDAALESAEHLMFHPALIDGSAVCGGGPASAWLEEGPAQQLALPLFYESFRASELLQKKCVARIRRTSARRVRELRYYTLEFFDEAGRNVAELKNLAGKLVRDPASITHATRERPAAAAVPLQVEAATDAQAPAIETFLRTLIANKLGRPVEQIGRTAGYYEMGIDSAGLLELVQAIEAQVGAPLSPTLLFEHVTIAELSAHLVESGVASGWTQRTSNGTSGASVHAPVDDAHDGIAIIGMSGRYPMANNLTEYWENLRSGRDCITEIPKDRWDHARYFDPEKGKPGKTYCKYGGFIDGVAEFDPMFFNISAREAQFMDPQERLFLQCAYETFEDAGYTREALKRIDGNVGVFVGVMYEEYQLYGAQTHGSEYPYALSASISAIANRVSYFFNLHGPSLAVDTMCSSSLTAIYLACQSLASGACEMAIAGGVNVSIHPNKYLMLGQGQFVSSAGRCKTFGQGGDGYVPGEGVGAVLLKPLAKAVADEDPIHGVIKGVAINHGGKASGFTVPNPAAQAQVIAQALREANVDPRTVSYLEAHGTGTSLGDPIEITGLTRAFAQSDTQYCAIGSVKSNIGHLESAAGISAVTKVLLQLRHRALVPSLHSETLNAHIDFTRTPFEVQQTFREWPRPVVVRDGKRTEYPRIAGVSSFGAGGSNAHVILEEFVESARPALSVTPGRPAIFVLSAKTAERVQERARQLLAHLAQHPYREDDLADIAYTLQVGREAMEHRLAFTAATLEELRANLEMATRGAEAMPAAPKILEHWLQGGSFDWNSLYDGVKPRRIRLPTYPFAKERYWMPDAVSKARVDVLHPLLHANTSDFEGQRFTSTFTGREFFFADHIVKGQRTLPGVAHLEMARAAFQRAAAISGFAGTRLENVVWARPATVAEAPVVVHIRLRPEHDACVYEIHGEGGTYSQGRVVSGPAEAPRQVDLESLRRRARHVTWTAEQCYAIYEAMGFQYGPAHRSLREVNVGTDARGSHFILARVELPADVADTREQYAVHPSVLDGALQASVGLLAAQQGEESAKLVLPFALERLSIVQACPAAVWVHLRMAADTSANVQKIDVDLIDDTGAVCIELRGFSSRVFDAEAARPTAEPFEVMTFEEQWQPQPLAGDARMAVASLVCIVPDASHEEALRAAFARLDPKVRVTVLASGHEDAEAYASAFRDVGSADAVLCLRAVQEPSRVGSYGGLLALLQGMERAGWTRTRLMLAGRYDDAIARCHLDAWTSLGSSLRSAWPDAPISVMAWPHAPGAWVDEWIPRLWAELVSGGAENVVYEQGERRVRRLHPTERSSVKPLLRRGGRYLITGGAGGLGLVFAQHLCRRYAAKVILTGRSDVNATTAERIAALEAAGGKVLYEQADVCDPERMRAVVARAREQFGGIDGVLHAAGVLPRELLGNTSLREFEETLAPKIAGSLALDAALQGEAPDFICHFSSMSAIMGDWGPASYAIANRFQMAYAMHRQRQVQSAPSMQARTKVLALAWPVWAQAGMGMANEEATRVYLEYSGQRALDPEKGLEIFEQLLGESPAQQLVIFGARARWHRLLGLSPKPELPRRVERIHDAPAPTHLSDPGTLKARTVRYLKQLLAAETQLPAARIDADARLESYGVDSVMTVRMTTELEKAFGSLSKTLLFEYQSLAALADYLVEHHREALNEILAPTSVAAHPAPATEPPPVKMPVPLRATTPAETRDIAVIGLSARFPQSENIHEFWENLKAGNDGITAIPPGRWDHREHVAARNLSGDVLDRGGFISGLDGFSHDFFNIKEDEVSGLDVQEKLFLESVWHLLEHAGYTSHHIKTRHQGNIGVFAGASAFVHAGFMTGMVAGRASGFLHLKGPTVVVDSHSASATTALHLACQALANGDCEVAIAGGVYVQSPELFYAFATWQQGMQPDCRGFSNAGGVLMSEGVGAALLKPLQAAVRDGDEILAVIKGSALTSAGDMANLPPEPTRLADVIRKCLDKAGIHPRTLGYAEAMAMGIPTGDYCEFAGFSKAFREQTADKGFCAMGTVESNIGHSIAACGIAQFTKVTMQIHHGQIVPTIKTDPLNPQIDLTDSPFYLQRSLGDWPMSDGPDSKRRGLFASRGRSGTLAAVVLEAHATVKSKDASSRGGEKLFLISAHTTEHLHRMARNLRRHTMENPHLDLTDLCYTTILRREPLRFRLAILASTNDELVSRLGEYLEMGAPARPTSGLQAKAFFGDALSVDSGIHGLLEPAEEKHLLETYLAERNWPKLAAFWVRGSDLRSVEGIERALGGHFIQIPLYPFRDCRERRDCRESGAVIS